MTDFNNNQVARVSQFLQNYMKKNDIKEMSANDCAIILAENNILPYNKHPAFGFNFRQMLRDGRDGHINLVKGARQDRPRAKWRIYSEG